MVSHSFSYNIVDCLWESLVNLIKNKCDHQQCVSHQGDSSCLDSSRKFCFRWSVLDFVSVLLDVSDSWLEDLHCSLAVCVFLDVAIFILFCVIVIRNFKRRDLPSKHVFKSEDMLVPCWIQGNVLCSLYRPTIYLLGQKQNPMIPGLTRWHHLSRRHHMHTFSQKLRCGWENIRKLF
jgi:hypothetical protein